MPVRVHNAASWQCPLPAHKLKQLIEAMLEGVGASHIAIEAHILRDGHMALANHEHMLCDGPTNVLSFPGERIHGLEAEEMPGILLLSVDTLARECLLYGQDKEEHMVRLLAHGMGHLQGLDHGEAMDALCQEMEEVGLCFLQEKGA